MAGGGAPELIPFVLTGLVPSSGKLAGLRRDGYFTLDVSVDTK